MDQDEERSECSAPFDGLRVTDVLAPPVDIQSVTEEAEIEVRSGRTTRGQDAKKCPTDPLPLHGNLTGAVINVSGDLSVDPKSCNVRITFTAGIGAADFPPGTDMGITFPLAAGAALTGHCVKTKDKKICKWSFTRTSP